MKKLAAAEHFWFWQLSACLLVQLSWVKTWLALACCWLSQNSMINEWFWLAAQSGRDLNHDSDSLCFTTPP